MTPFSLGVLKGTIGRNLKLHIVVRLDHVFDGQKWVEPFDCFMEYNDAVTYFEFPITKLVNNDVYYEDIIFIVQVYILSMSQKMNNIILCFYGLKIVYR